MENARLLYDAYNIYYEKGTSALLQKNYSVAARNLFSASETLFKLAKVSDGALKEKRFQKADEIYHLAEEVQNKIKSTGSASSQGALSDLQRLGGSSSQEGKSKKGTDRDDTLTCFTPVSDTGVSLDDVAGLQEAKDEIYQKIVQPIKHPEIFAKFKKKKGGGVLLYGVPGTGKTMLAQALAHEIDAKFFAVKCSDIISKWVGNAEQNIHNLFEEARKYPTSIIFFDEFESIGTKRDTYSTVMKRVVPELLEQIQGFEKNENTLLVIAATNRPYDIDSAFLRPGRFDKRIYVPLPDDDARLAIFNNQFKGVPVDDCIDLDYMVEKSNGFNGSDCVALCDKVKDLAIDRAIKTGEDTTITNDDILQATATTYSSVQRADLEKLGKYQEETNMRN